MLSTFAASERWLPAVRPLVTAQPVADCAPGVAVLVSKAVYHHGAEVKHRGTLRTLLVQASAECPACPSVALRAASAAAAHRPHHHGAEVKHRGTLRTLLVQV